MVGHCSVCLFLASVSVVTWNPDQWIALIRVMEIPGLCAIAIVAWRSKISLFLDAIIKLIEGPVKFEGFGIKLETLPPENVVTKGARVLYRIKTLSLGHRPRLMPNVPERYRKLEVVRQQRNEPQAENGSDKQDQ